MNPGNPLLSIRKYVPEDDRPITHYQEWYYGAVMDDFNEAQEQLKQYTKNISGGVVKLSREDKILDRPHNAAYRQNLTTRDGMDEIKDTESEEHVGGKSWAKPCKESDSKKNWSKKAVFSNASAGAVEYFSCPECHRCFNKKSNLIRHRTTHTGDRPYECNQCKKTFNKKSNLVRHQRTHSTERVFKCCDCESKFDRLSDLHKHQKVHVGDQVYSCNDCKKIFSRKSNLVRHQIQHHSSDSTYAIVKPKLELLAPNEQEYSCNACEKSFSQLSALNEHLQVHLGDQPYACNECNLTFENSSNYIYHKKVHADQNDSMQSSPNAIHLQDSGVPIL